MENEPIPSDVPRVCQDVCNWTTRLFTREQSRRSDEYETVDGAIYSLLPVTLFTILTQNMTLAAAKWRKDDMVTMMQQCQKAIQTHQQLCLEWLLSASPCSPPKVTIVHINNASKCIDYLHRFVEDDFTYPSKKTTMPLYLELVDGYQHIIKTGRRILRDRCLSLFEAHLHQRTWKTTTAADDHDDDGVMEYILAIVNDYYANVLKDQLEHFYTNKLMFEILEALIEKYLVRMLTHTWTCTPSIAKQMDRDIKIMTQFFIDMGCPAKRVSNRVRALQLCADCVSKDVKLLPHITNSMVTLYDDMDESIFDALLKRRPSMDKWTRHEIVYAFRNQKKNHTAHANSEWKRTTLFTRLAKRLLERAPTAV